MSAVPLSGSISDRITQLRLSLPASVRLIAITKQVSLAAMREAYAAGVRDFGESRVQEAEMKQAQLQDLPDITWHLIGHLQMNKAKKAVQLFEWIHSVDSLKLAQRLNQIAMACDLKPHVCLQVKLAPDPDKFGWHGPELMADLAALNDCTALDIRGLMSILPLGLTDAEALSIFQQTRALAQTIQQQNWSNLKLQELSMGMSGDYLLAVQAGATMIRLGRILFGDREL